MLGVGFNIGRTRNKIKRAGGSGGTRSYTSDFSSGVDSWSAVHKNTSTPSTTAPVLGTDNGWLTSTYQNADDNNDWYTANTVAFSDASGDPDISNGDPYQITFKAKLSTTAGHFDGTSDVEFRLFSFPTNTNPAGSSVFSVPQDGSEVEISVNSTVGSNSTHGKNILIRPKYNATVNQNAVLYIKDVEATVTAAANSANKSARVSRTNQLLDSYTSPSFAFSLRRLDADLEVTNCIRVRRENDNVEADISYIGFNLDTGAIASHCGTSNGFVSKWYDQSGNGNDAVQTVHGSQPKIYDRGSGVVTENGKPALDFSNDTLNLTNSVTSNAMTVFDVRHDAADYFLRDDGTTHSDGDYIYSHLFGQIRTYLGGVFAIDMTSGAAASGVQRLLTFTKPGTSGVSARHYKNGVDLFDAGYSSVDDESGTFTRLGHSYVGKSQELIFYNRDESLNKEVIWSNINKHYEIGNFGEPDSGILAEFEGAAAAYSVRQLSDTAFKCMRVRRDTSGGAGDDDEQDFGFDANGDLDTAGIATFVGSGNNGYVSKWYDQSGNGNYAAQTTHGSQPQIYNGSAVITDNGKPAIEFSSSSINHMDFNSSVNYQTNAATMITTVVNQLGTKANNVVVSDGSSAGNSILWSTFGNSLYFFNGNRVANRLQVGQPSGWDDTQHLVAYQSTTSIMSIYVDGSSLGTKSSISSENQSLSGISLNNAYNFAGTMQEIVIWPSDESSNRSGIEGNINAHFKIGNFGTPTSGLLSTYTGAEAAYSVRQLANTAALSMRVRRDNDDAEQDFGFDANGDLDTAAIATFVGSGNNGYVSKWYDQSGNQVNAEQAAHGTQPQIYGGSAVITENGKPAVKNGRLEITTFTGSTNGTLSTVMANIGSGIPILVIKGGLPFAYRSASGSSTSAYRGFGVSNTFINGVEYTNLTQGEAHTAFSASQGHAMTIAQTSLWTNYSIGIDYYGGVDFQEVIFWNSDQTSNRSGIETDINNYFSIY